MTDEEQQRIKKRVEREFGRRDTPPSNVRSFDFDGAEASHQPADDAKRIADGVGRRLPLVDLTEELKRAFEKASVSFLSRVVDAAPTTAEVVARLDNEGRSAAILKNRCGKGEAFRHKLSPAF